MLHLKFLADVTQNFYLPAQSFSSKCMFSKNSFIRLSGLITNCVGFAVDKILDSNWMWLYLLLSSSLATCTGLWGWHCQSKTNFITMETWAFVSFAISFCFYCIFIFLFVFIFGQMLIYSPVSEYWPWARHSRTSSVTSASPGGAITERYRAW